MATTFVVNITLATDVQLSLNSEVGVIKSAMEAIVQDFGRNVGRKLSGDAVVDNGIPAGHTASATWTYTTAATS
jgi:hypothetical protein